MRFTHEESKLHCMQMLNSPQALRISRAGTVGNVRIEVATGRTQILNYMSMQQGVVLATWADAHLMQSLIGYTQRTDLRTVAQFVDRYRGLHRG